MNHQDHLLRGRIETAATVATALAALVSCVVLAGWALDRPILTSFLPEMERARIQVALSLLLGIAALWALRSPTSTWRVQLGVLLALMPGLAGVFGFIHYIPRLSQWLAPMERLLSEGAPYEYVAISPITATTLMLTCVSLLLLRVRIRGQHSPAQWIALVPLSLSLVVLVGYTYGVETFYGLGQRIAMSLPAAISAFALSFAIVMAEPDRLPVAFLAAPNHGGFLVRRLLPAAVAFPLVFGFFGVWGQQMGLYSTAFGTATFAIANAIFFSLLIGRISWRLARIDAQRVAAEAAIREPELRFRATFNNTAVGVAHVGLDGRWLRFNARICQITGYSSQEFQHLTFQQITHPDDLAADLDQARRLLAGEIEHYSMDKRYIRKDGSHVWVTLTASLVRDEAGHPDYFIAVVQDVTQRKQSEDALYQREALLNAILDSMPAGVLIFDSAGKIVRTNRALDRMWGKLEDTDFEAYQHWVRYIPGNSRPILFDEWPCARALNGENVSETLEFERFDNGEQRFELVNAAPVTDRNGKVIGAVAVQMDITEQKRATEALRDSDERLRLAMESAVIGTWEVDLRPESPAQQTLKYSRLTGPMFGHPEGYEHPSMEEWAKQIHPEDKQHVMAALAQAIDEDREYKAEFRAVWSDGTVRWIAARGAMLRDGSGRVVRGIGIAMDVTERKRSEQALQQREALLNAIVDSMPAGVLIFDANGKLARTNRGITNIWGQPRPGTDLSDYDQWVGYFPGTHHRLRTQDWPFARALKGEEVMETLEIQRFDTGEHRFELVSAAPVRDPKGKVNGAVAVQMDITEQKRATEALRESENLYRFTLELTGLLTWSTDANGQVLKDCPIWRKFTGLTFQETRGVGWIKAIHPDDSQRAQQAWMQAVAERKMYQVEFRLRRFDGVYKNFMVRGMPLTNADGTVREWVGVCIDITERKQAEALLRASEERFRSVVETMSEGLIIFDAQANIIFQNPASKRIQGFAPGEPDHLTREELPKTFNVWDRTGKRLPFEEWIIPRVLRHERVEKTILRAQRTDTGYEWWASYTGGPVYDSQGKLTLAFLTIRDVTAELRAQEALERARSVLAEAQRIAHLGSFEYHAETGTTTWSEEEYRIYGLDPAGPSPAYRDLLAKHIHPEDAARLHAAFTEALESRSIFEFENRILRPDGTVRWVFNRAQPSLDDCGNLLGYVGATLDITERKLAEDGLRQLTEELEERVRQRTAELTASNQELEAFAYSVSHDLRAPLRHMMSFTKILEKTSAQTLNENGLRYLKIITEAGQRMDLLLNELLKLSRLGREPLHRTEVRLADLVEQARQEIAPELDGRPVEWQIAPMPTVNADPALLGSVFVNLLGNAAKYTRGRNPAHIEVGCREAPGELVCFVKDNGAGFDMRFASKLFGIFQRLHRAEEFEGTGVGLASVHRVIQRHGGRTWAEGTVNQGATFYFSLPKRQSA